ncbi:MAG: hypothetical protein K8T91_14385 [Planctomycetes bacterium]|nr:hypothetical protein [Planctomycetota bacterium]
MRGQFLVAAICAAFFTLGNSTGFATEEFQILPVTSEVKHMTASEDCRYLAVLHPGEDALTILDFKTQEIVKELKTNRPTWAIFRGDRLIVANGGAATLSIFAPSKNWELLDEVKVGRPEPELLAAPQGKNFNNFVLVYCAGDRRYNMPVMLVNIAKDKFVELSNGWTSSVSVDFAGRNYFAQGGTGSPSRAIGGVGDFKALTKGKQIGVAGGHGENMPLVYQVADGPFWFGGRQVAKGIPPRLVGDALGEIVVPDRMAAVCYGVNKDKLTCYALNASLSKIESREITIPEKFGRLHKGINGNDAAGTDHMQVAATVDGKLYCYLWDYGSKTVYFSKMDGFKAPAPSSAVASKSKRPGSTEASKTAGSATKVGEEGAIASNAEALPKKIEVGKQLSYRLLAEQREGSYRLVNGPATIQISNRGMLTWTPSKEDVGPQDIKVRVVIGGTATFVRLETEVVDLTDVPEAARPKADTAGGGNRGEELEHVGVHSVNGDHISLCYDTAGTMLLLDGRILHVLDKTGMVVEKTHEFEESYRQIAARPDYYVALAPKSLDLIDRKTFKVIRSIALDFSQVEMLAVDPAHKRSFVTTRAATKKKPFDKCHPVVVVDEVRGEVEELPDVYGLRIVIDPAGKRLFTAAQDLEKDGQEIDLRLPGGVRDLWKNFDVVQAYDISQDPPRLVGSNDEPGANGQRLVISPDGRHVSYVAGGGAPGNPYSIAALSTADIGRESSRYQIQAYPQDACYHPSANLVACTNGGKIWFFNRKTGVALDDRIDAGQSRNDIRHIYFAPDGKRLMVNYAHPKLGRVVEAVSLKLSPTELEEIARGPQKPLITAETAPPKAKKHKGDLQESGAGLKYDPPDDFGADPGDSEPVRTWTDSRGKTIEAAFDSTQDGKVQLRKADGKILTVPLDRLQKSDQEYVRSRPAKP